MTVISAYIDLFIRGEMSEVNVWIPLVTYSDDLMRNNVEISFFWQLCYNEVTIGVNPGNAGIPRFWDGGVVRSP